MAEIYEGIKKVCVFVFRPQLYLQVLQKLWRNENFAHLPLSLRKYNKGKYQKKEEETNLPILLLLTCCTLGNKYSEEGTSKKTMHVVYSTKLIVSDHSAVWKWHTVQSKEKTQSAPIQKSTCLWLQQKQKVFVAHKEQILSISFFKCGFFRTNGNRGKKINLGDHKKEEANPTEKKAKRGAWQQSTMKSKRQQKA